MDDDAKDDAKRDNIDDDKKVNKDKDAAAEKAKKEKEEQEARKVKLKGGDYVVQVHVIEARDLKGRGLGDMSDPICIVKCMGKEKHTRIHKSALNVVFDQVLYFEFKGLEPGEVAAGRVTVSVFDANTFRRNQLIGLYEFDCAGVYYKKHHEIFRQWCALTDVTDENEGIQGYLKLSVVVLGPDDEQHVHSPDEEDDEDSAMMSVLMPPQIEQKGKLVKIRVYAADELPMMDSGLLGGTCDPYIKAEFAGVNIKTEHKDGRSVTFNKELQLPVMEPVMGAMLRLSAYDWNGAKTDDRIKTIMLNYDDLRVGGQPLHWVNLYGAPIGKQRGMASKMNRGYIDGSTYRGRMLMSVSVVDKEEPTAEVVDCPGILDHERPAVTNYTIECDLYEGSELPDKSDLRVEVTVGSHSVQSSEKTPRKSRVKWYEELKSSDDDSLTVTYPRDLDQVPDIVVYLRSGSKRICYLRYKFRDIVDRNWIAPPEWVSLIEDPVYDALDGSKAEFPGVILLSLRAGVTSSRPHTVDPRNRPLKQMSASASVDSVASVDDVKSSGPTPPPRAKGPVPTYGTLKITVAGGRDLPVMDRNSSDPYVKVIVDDEQQFQTKTIKKTLNPEWNETFTAERVPISARIKVLAYDEDFGKDDKMGEFYIDLRAQSTAAGAQPGRDWSGDNWFLVNSKYPNAAIHFKFQFRYLPLAMSQAAASIDQQKEKSKGGAFDAFKGTMKKLVRKTSSAAGLNRRSGVLGDISESQFQLRCHIYQARNLPAKDDSGTSDPFVVVRLCGESVKTKVRKKTINPCWYQNYCVNVDLPVPLSLAPNIQLFVFDWDRFGDNDALGRLTFNIKDALSTNADTDDLQPQWLQLYDWDGKEVGDAKILVAFQLLDARLASAKVPSIVPETVPMWLELTTLGLRNLSSTLGVFKPFVDFELPNMKHYQTNPSRTPSAINPNFLQIMKLPIDLPVNKIFAPTIDIEARDSLFGGLVKRAIGNASLPLEQFMLTDEKDPRRWTVADADHNVLDEKELKEEIRLEKEEKARKEREAAEAAKRAKEEAKRKNRKVRAKAAGVSVDQLDDEEDDEDDAPLGLVEDELNVLTKSDSNLTDTHDETQAAAVDSTPDTTKAELEDYKYNTEPSSSGPPGRSLLESHGMHSDANLDHPTLDDDDDGAGIGADVELADRKHEDRPAETTMLSRDKKSGDVKIDIDDFAEADQSADFNIDELKAVEEDDDMPKPEYMKGRKTIADELEDHMEMKPFNSIELFTGQKNAGLFSQRHRSVGVFKGLIRLLSDKRQESCFNVQELLRPKELYVRLYILRGAKMIPKDADGTSDPYLKIKLGKWSTSTRERKIKDSLDPDFYESFEIPCTIPGDAHLEITVMDWDGIGDDLIGSTTIDIEDRWFSKNWRKLDPKPVEWRTLKSPTSTAPQGKLQMWMEIVTPLQAKRTPLLNIKPPPPDPYEIRVIIWGCRDVTIKDTFTEQNDLYVTCSCSYPGLKKQETDTHLRSKKGKGNFNWRMKFPVELPVKGVWPRLRFQIWDKDFFSANDSICEAIVSLKGLCRQAMKKKDRAQIKLRGNEKFWLEDLRHPNFSGNQGRLQVSVEILPQHIAKQLPAGFGRSDPNQNPYLPPPPGRVKWSIFHPLDMLREILGDNLFRKICCIFFVFTLLSMLSFVAPMIFSNVMSRIIVP